MRKTGIIILLAIVFRLLQATVHAEVMLQYFNTDYTEITDKMPELAEAGYTSLWLPPPTKGSGGLSVGYDLWDPLDIGGREQRSTVRTRYGTESQLLTLIETAHRFGIRIYFDNIMNHRAFDIPGYNEDTPIDVYPGMAAEDFHLQKTSEGFYRKWDNCRDWNSAWQVQNLGLSDLIDIAHETPNVNFGYNEGDSHPKQSWVRHPDNPEFYLDTDLPIGVGYGDYDWNEYTFANKETYQDIGYTNSSAEFVAAAAGNGRFDWEDANGDGQHSAGEASEPFADTGLEPERPGWNDVAHGVGDGIYNMGNPVEEDVGAYLIRAARWLMDKTKCDGLRLDAVKHVPDYFFGEFGSDTSGAGYCGGAQVQFNLSRGFNNDWGNHRDTVFDTEKPRDDAMMFGEHLGSPPGYDGYFSAGMRLVDNDLRSKLNGILGSMWSGLEGMDQSGSGGFAPGSGVMHAQSHDNDYAACRELQHAMYFTRAGLGLLYTDGNHQAATLGESGGAFPRHANTSFLGQWSDNRVPNLLYIHNQFARGYQQGKWADNDYLAYERLDWRQGGSTDADKVTMLFLMNDNYSGAEARGVDTSFPHVSGEANAYLYNYSDYGGGFYTWASDLYKVLVPGGGYFVFSWKNPDPSDLWAQTGGGPLMIYENGEETSWMPYDRVDGPDGDAAYNPHGVPDTNTEDYTYTWWVPRITSGTNLRFVARVDGSANAVLFKLDGGMDLNGTKDHDWDYRDNPPTTADDLYLGYENSTFVKRIHREKFASTDSNSNKIGSAGATTYQTAWGSGGFTVYESSAVNAWDSTETARYIWHNPEGTTDVGAAQSDNVGLWVKTGTPGSINKVFCYFTTDGSFPEGAGGEGKGTTHTTELVYDHADSGDGDDWWRGVLPELPDGTDLRYKVGCFREQGEGSWDVIWPGGPNEIALKTTRMGVWEIDNFNAQAAGYYPHTDYSAFRTGLVEGFHFLQARAFLQRDNAAAIYNTYQQTFYYDTERPQGIIQWPQQDGDSVGGQQYGVVALTDPSVREVWYHIDDCTTNNDDVVTGVANGNGNGFEPYTDGNSNGKYDDGELFEDLNENGVWDPDVGASWQLAVVSSSYIPRADGFAQQWKFNYVNIPAGGSNAIIKVRLREWSSATRADWLNERSDEDGHYTTLARTVKTWGPDYRMSVGWPQKDGDSVGAGYDMKVYFTKALADNLSEEQLINNFLIKVQSSMSGETSGGSAVDRDEYSILWNVTDDYHALVWTMPNLYNGQLDWLHGIEVTLARESLPDMMATRLVKAVRAEQAPYVEIVEPRAYDSDGQKLDIELPDVAEPQAGDRLIPVRIGTVSNAVSMTLTLRTAPAAYQGGFVPVTNRMEGATMYWEYEWTNLVEGSYSFAASVLTDGGASNTASMSTRVVFREKVTANDADEDDDDDGMPDTRESNGFELPEDILPENWDNETVQKYYVCGKSSPLSPDTDGDGLPDALELGWRTPSTNLTDETVDTNGDGWKNYIVDLDPPFYNVVPNYGNVPGVDSQSKGGDRTKLLYGTTTDPNRSDSDYDGLPDGIEDMNRNGWVDGDGDGLPIGWEFRNDSQSWPNGELDAGETWTETDPNNADTDADGMSDGSGEDTDCNGWIGGDSNSNRVYDTGEAWFETDPLDADTDGDGLPDGWEIWNGLDPLDNGKNSYRTTEADDGNINNGPDGDPDNDGFSNQAEMQNGTNPKKADSGTPPPEGSIVIGPGALLGTIAGVDHYQEFTDWSSTDLIALDEYNNDAQNSAVDIYRRWDGFDTSRDMLAFYAHDGGSVDDGGDDNFYFRVDFHDLQAYAEEDYLNVYVVIDLNSPDSGEFCLPDEVDTGTKMRWEVVVAAYGWNHGTVFVDLDPANNTISQWQNLADFGVVSRDQNSADGFGEAYFSSQLDSCEFSIARKALLDAGWNGNWSNLNYQVFTVKDNTCNSCFDGAPGSGDIGGRSDLTDSITDDWICSDYWRDQDYIAQNGYLSSWVGLSDGDSNDREKSAKLAMLIHGNQQILPGSVIQNLINTGEGAGYYRPIGVHDVYREPAESACDSHAGFCP